MVQRRVIVIGSGIAGASFAFAAARRGAAVTIIDSAETGQATAASAGIIAPWASATDGVFYDLYAAGAAFYPEVLARLDDAGVTRTEYRRTGALVVGADLEKLQETHDRVAIRARAAGAVAGTVERIGNDDVRALFPPLARELEGVHISGGARVDGRTMCSALLTAARRAGATSLSGTAHLTPDPRGVPALEVNGERIEADDIVIAAGAWTNVVLKPFGIQVPVAPQRGQITHLRVEGVDTSGWPSVRPLSSHYMVAFDDSRVAIGATRETGSGFDPRVTAAGQLEVLQDALRIAPGLADATFIETRVGLRPLPDGHLPVIGPVPDTPGLHVLSGFGAAGLTMGPFAGDALARAVLEDRPPAEIAAFAPAP
ncbi:FAD-dependent oxidoreductase [Nonomuraea sp. K274]|uniref:FAD-dependent oxidoreductase n=1 Tax=Nonomuraea cypriaca TaxID=1187855 RepID=A0A931F1M1_9ACTN|nr:FAD-dependent oxidoreductase [Nonomuraea cypriaca]MBF8190640.1 FAD-dependent oxidoreductase [Nonomuraea cypriaca]